MLEAFTREGADRLLLLGDILYHGPRNPLPEEYSPKDVAEMLSEVKSKIICVCGNCDAEIDRDVLPFNLSDSAAIFVDGLNIFLAHGHGHVPPLSGGDVYITGHTHIPLKETGEYFHLNPGSISLPKDESKHAYIVYENRKFIFKDIEGVQYDSLEVIGGNGVIRHPPMNFRRKLIRRHR